MPPVQTGGKNEPEALSHRREEQILMAVSNIADKRAEKLAEAASRATQAIQIGNAPSGSDEWHAMRATGIGGSEVGTICGLNKWESPMTLWAKKLGKIPSNFEKNEAMEWGTRLEPVILDKFEDEHPELHLIRDAGTWRHPEREWQIANPDGIYVTKEGTHGIVEVKTAQYEDDWSDGVPRYYETQVQWYLQTFGFEHAYVVALFHGNRYREYEVIANAIAQEAALERVEQFRIFLETDTQPDFDGAMSTYQTLRAINPEITDEEVELGELGIHYYMAETQLKAAEAKMNEMKSRVLAAMGTAKRGTIEGRWAVTRQARGAGTPFLVSKRG